MYTVPDSLRKRIGAQLSAEGVPVHLQGHYQKWIRYFLDFCEKYRSGHSGVQSLEPFLEKLRSKGQGKDKREQARRAVLVFINVKTEDAQVTWPQVRAGEFAENYSPSHPTYSREDKNYRYFSPQRRAPGRLVRPYADQRSSQQADLSRSADTLVRDQGEREDIAGQVREATHGIQADTVSGERGPGTGASSWQKEFSRLAEEIALRHYSQKTLKSYRHYVRQFQAFTRSKDPQTLTTEDVKEYLTHLAVEKQIAASTQNLAFNALLFFFRHVLGREFGKIDGVVRAKQRPYIPVVLSRREIDAVLGHLDRPYDLVVKMLYGCGLRLFECLELRLHCLDFDGGLVTVHDGKGKKDRTVPLPKMLVAELGEHVDGLRELHRRDLEKGYGGVFLVNALERKYRGAATEFGWQWLFPAKQLTRQTGSGMLKRYHLHATHVQKALRQAVREVGICKRVTAHTFRHSYASHLLQNNYDIRTIQELLGHGDIRTTMIYTHTVKKTSRTEAGSPLDFSG